MIKKHNPKTDGYNLGPVDEMVEEDQMALRKVETEKGVEFIIVQREPWALWEVRKAKGGKSPIEGTFTSESLALKAIEIYKNKNA